MSWPPEYYTTKASEQDEDDIKRLYNRCIDDIFEIQGFLENDKVDKLVRGLKELELKYLQGKARFLSEQFEIKTKKK